MSGHEHIRMLSKQFYSLRQCANIRGVIKLVIIVLTTSTFMAVRTKLLVLFHNW